MADAPPAPTGPAATRRRALLSVSDKAGLAEFATGLARLGFDLISTGGTACVLAEAGLAVTPIEAVTGLPEMMDGRVKTLHPAVHGGILARPGHAGDEADLARHGFADIDLVCVNLYPFRETARRAGAADAEIIEQIDIGGPCLIRAAAKNSGRVAVVTDPGQYGTVLEGLEAGAGDLEDTLRRTLARDAFTLTARYDAAIAGWLDGGVPGGGEAESLPLLTPVLTRTERLRYGENPHQAAAVYIDPDDPRPSVLKARQLHGKALSYNNLADAAAALEIASGPAPEGAVAACVVKHTNPCGFAYAASPADAARLAIAGDPLAAYGGIFATSGRIDEAAAEVLAVEDRFFEVIIAAGYDAAALDRLRDRWTQVRLLSAEPALGSSGGIDTPLSEPRAGEGGVLFRSVPGGMLGQQADRTRPSPDAWTHRAGPPPDDEFIRVAAAMDWAVRALSSNAVCIGGVEPGGVRLIGAGAGQMDRVAACRIAIEKAGAAAAGGVAASDAFFPFPDGPRLLIDAGVRGIVHPGGSKRDEETFAACDEAGVICLTTGVRRFRH